MSLMISPAQKEDAGLIYDFIVKLAVYEKLEHEVEATAADIERELFGENARIFCDIAYWDGVPVGFALWFYTFSTFQGRSGIWLEDIFIEPEARGNGIGKALMKNLAKRCKDENLGRFEWWVLNWNEPSIEFYKRQGAVMQDEWTVCRVSGQELDVLGA